KPDLAVADETRAIDLAPTRVQYRNRGLAYRRLDRCDDAIRDLDRAIELDGGYVQAYQDRAKCLVRLKLLDRAGADVAKLRELGAFPDEELRALLAARSR